MSSPPRDRLRELLDAVLGEGSDAPASGTRVRLSDLASSAHSSMFHFARQVAAATGEAPVELRRRVTLERAAWRLGEGASVTDVAFEAGYDSVDGFARAFRRAYGCAPSAHRGNGRNGHWLPAPNGLHFHAPGGLYLSSATVPPVGSAGEVVALLVHHDLDDVDRLLTAATALTPDAYRALRLPGHRTMEWGEPAESLSAVLRHLVLDKLQWLAAIDGEDAPNLEGDELADLTAWHNEIAPRWLALMREIDREQRWNDSIVDALCDPPESFRLSEIVAHVVTFSAHYRQIARWMLADAGVARVLTGPLDPDPIIWHRRSGGPL
ncbi:MAG: helix-turn-helix domain-containing protein [Acidimicrobiales bacterium]|nr:helix-turn-helix domain-containing protein [Acidimicrobiales bacterium]